MRRLGAWRAALGAVSLLIASAIALAALIGRTVHSPTPAQPTALAVRSTATPVPLIAPPSETPTATHTPTPTLSVTPNYILITATPRLLPTATPPPPSAPSAGACAPPEGWQPYRVQAGDTLFGFVLGANGAVDVATIKQANCLTSHLLRIGQVLFLPPGAGENAPKLDDPSGAPEKAPRPSRCPCKITIRPGVRLEQIAEQIDKLPAAFRGRDFLAATSAAAALPDYWFLRSKPADRNLEGYMLSGTYTITPEMDAVQFRDLILANFAANVPQAYESMAAARGLSFWQALTLASIVQRESWNAADQRMVAGVFHNRLAAGRPLGATVTMMYALGRAGQWWYPARKIDFSQAHPYNTLRNRGLPPSPICSPSLSALAAALDPAQHDYYYFNIRCGGGGNFYARTYEEFKAGLQCR
ncbi:MAG: endolytic transglycosylase MltG [Chloroflexi bacterium]|nr:endolytic transglycosylase MltG [Chloroflexota bacterium]